jgi:ubiquitin-protein ligase
MAKRLEKEWKHLSEIENDFFTLEQCLSMNWTVIMHMSQSSKSVYHSNQIRIRLLFSHEYPFLPPKIVFETPLYHPLIRESTTCSRMFEMHWGPTHNVLWILRELYKIVEGEGRYNTRECNLQKTYGRNNHRCCIADTFSLFVLAAEYPIYEHIVQQSTRELAAPLCQNNRWRRHSSKCKVGVPEMLEFETLYYTELDRRRRKISQISALFIKYNLSDVHEKMVIRLTCPIHATRDEFWSYHVPYRSSGSPLEEIQVETREGVFFSISKQLGIPILDPMPDKSSVRLANISSIEFSKILELLKGNTPPPIRKYQPPTPEITHWKLHRLDNESIDTLVSLLKVVNFLGLEQLVLLICLKISEYFNTCKD